MTMSEEILALQMDGDDDTTQTAPAGGEGDVSADEPETDEPMEAPSEEPSKDDNAEAGM